MKISPSLAFGPALFRRSSLLLAVLAASLVGSGCARANRADNPFDSPQESQIRIVVINHDFNDATLLAVGNGERRRLGVVTGKTEVSYTIPWRMTGPLQIEISLLAAGSCSTPELQVEPGEVLELQIQQEAVRRGQCSGPRGG